MFIYAERKTDGVREIRPRSCLTNKKYNVKDIKTKRYKIVWSDNTRSSGAVFGEAGKLELFEAFFKAE